MYAIVEIAGQQFKVEEGKKIFVHRLEAEEGNKIEFDKVLLIEDEGKIVIGEPTIKDTVVEGKILNNKVRGDKVIVFKKKRKKGYRVKNGHRQNFTQVEIISIGGKSSPEKVAAKKETAETVEEPVKEKKSEVKKPVAEKKKETEKKSSAKKSAEKSPASKKPAAGKSSKAKK